MRIGTRITVFRNAKHGEKEVPDVHELSDDSLLAGRLLNMGGGEGGLAHPRPTEVEHVLILQVQSGHEISRTNISRFSWWNLAIFHNNNFAFSFQIRTFDQNREHK